MVLHFVDEPPRSTVDNKKQHAQVSRQHSARHISPTGRSTSRQCPHHRGQHAHNSSSRTPRKLFQVASWMRNATFWPHMTSSSPPNCIEILPQSTCEANPEMAFWQGLKAQARFGGGFARLIRLRSPPETRKKQLGFWYFSALTKFALGEATFFLQKKHFCLQIMKRQRAKI